MRCKQILRADFFYKVPQAAGLSAVSFGLLVQKDVAAIPNPRSEKTNGDLCKIETCI